MVNWQQVLVVFVILLFAVVYYGLAFLALRDLYRRPAVRGDNKIVWGLLILCLPIVGALYYGYAGAASFLPRPPDRFEHGSLRPPGSRRHTQTTDDTSGNAAPRDIEQDESGGRILEP